jgi:hypothetical protein
MKVGGNSHAHSFFQQYGGASQFKDVHAKYTSKTAVQYKEKLLERAQEDYQKSAFFLFSPSPSPSPMCNLRMSPPEPPSPELNRSPFK